MLWAHIPRIQRHLVERTRPDIKFSNTYPLSNPAEPQTNSVTVNDNLHSLRIFFEKINPGFPQQPISPLISPVLTTTSMKPQLESDGATILWSCGLVLQRTVFKVIMMSIVHTHLDRRPVEGVTCLSIGFPFIDRSDIGLHHSKRKIEWRKRMRS